MSTVKEAFEEAKAKEAATSTEATDSDEKNKIEELKSEYEAKLAKLQKDSENYQTEALKLRQDLSENIKFTQSLLEKEKNIEPNLDMTDEDLLDRINSRPRETLLGLIKQEVNKTAKQYEDKIEKLTQNLTSDTRGTKVELAKGVVKSKYTDFDKDWDRLVQWGDKYNYHTRNATDPEHLEAFYVMFKHMNKEELKPKKTGIDENTVNDILSKKLAAGLDSSTMPNGKTPSLTEQQKVIADRYGLSAAEYHTYNNPHMDYNQYKKSQGGK